MICFFGRGGFQKTIPAFFILPLALIQQLLYIQKDYPPLQVIFLNGSLPRKIT